MSLLWEDKSNETENRISTCIRALDYVFTMALILSIIAAELLIIAAEFQGFDPNPWMR